MELVKELITDIAELDSKIVSHTDKLKSVINDTLSKLCSQEEKLANIINKNAEEHKRGNELLSLINQRNLEIKKNESTLAHVITRIKEIDFNESKIEALNTEIKKLNEERDNLSAEVEIFKTDKDIASLKVSEVADTITKLKNDYDILSESIINAKNEYKTLSNNIISANDNLKGLKLQESIYISDKVKAEESLSKSTEEYNTINDKITESKSLLANTDTKNKNELEKAKEIKSEIASLNEIKDNITHEIENAKLRARSDESRILAIKKEVLKYILDNKKNIDVAKINKFVKELK